MGRREHSSGAKALKKYADSLEDFAEMGFSASGGRDGKNRLSTGNLRQAAHKLGRKQRELEKKLGLTPDQRITGTMPSEKIDAAEKRRLLRQQAELDSDRERKISDGSESIADDLRTVLAQASLTAETAKDQHFLVSQEAMDKILAAANLGQGDVIIEIGPGPGHVTRRLAERAGKLHVIELDTKFKEVLHGLAGELGNIDIIFGSAVDKSIPWPKDATKIVTNLPYSILEPFLLRLALEKNIDEVTLMTGESYYRRLTAGLAHTSKTGIITQAFFDVELVTKLDKSDFDPPPREESVVLKLTRASAKKKDYGIRMLASKMLITPKQTVEGLLREVVQDETYRKMQRERDWKNLPSYSQLSVPDGLRGHQIGRLNNSQIDKVARIIRGIRSDDRRGTSRLEADEELD